ncbi:hypothetical protein NC653_033285 [Populus alba x Populus x berolinensis]|uniref:Uncharacterized protein n=1 Tax=Populus alba x Populus x berolinensis TaxID=444605 RepID=A0AAD6PYX6_9ROSI|nr:hypothetical protein NC653_033285 [Populus alba x Populus x berolinensis]
MGKSWGGCRQPDITTTYQAMRSMDLGEACKGGGYGIFSRGDRLRGRFITCLHKLPLRSFTTAKAARPTGAKLKPNLCRVDHDGIREEWITTGNLATGHSDGQGTLDTQANPQL